MDGRGKQSCSLLPALRGSLLLLQLTLAVAPLSNAEEGQISAASMDSASARTLRFAPPRAPGADVLAQVNRTQPEAAESSAAQPSAAPPSVAPSTGTQAQNIAAPVKGSSQTVSRSPDAALSQVIDDYVREGLRSNLALRSQTLEVERNIAALDEARARLFPALALDARYTRAEGGREIQFPVGTLLNPVYSTLNDLLAAQGQPARFDRIDDLRFAFLREREQDTRLTVRQPIYAPAIPAAVRAQSAQLEATQFGRMALARRLKRDITVTYLDWLKAANAVEIVRSSLTLLEENLRVNESLFRNGRITQDQVLRARAELLAVEQQLREAQNTQTQAQSLMNFLLNRSLSEALRPAAIGPEVVQTARDLGSLRVAALANRPEISQLDRAANAAKSQIQIARSDLKPTVSFGVDAGTQSEEYEFGRGRDFATVSLLLNWQLFDGGAIRARVRGAQAAARQAEMRRDEIAQQIQLEVQQALDRLATTTDSLATAEARAEAARAAFRIAGRKRDEGAISQVEFIDSRSALTSAELNLNVTQFDVLARQAELDYATAAGTLPELPAGTE